MDLSFLPAVNAALNGLSTLLLLTGYGLIRRKRIVAHRNVMISAFVVSALFLALYLTHKAWKGSTQGALHTTFNHEGWLKVLYLAILFTHLTLAMAVPVLAIMMIRLGLTGRIPQHRKLARVTLPIWLYVSITGVVIYFMLYHWNA